MSEIPQALIPFLIGGAAGAGYGAWRAPGGSAGRGAVIGGTGGLGAGLGLMTANALLDSEPGRHVVSSPGVAAATALGGAGLGLAAGVHGGRELADRVGLKGRKDNDPKNDLAEIDLTSRSRPGTLGDTLRTLLLLR